MDDGFCIGGSPEGHRSWDDYRCRYCQHDYLDGDVVMETDLLTAIRNAKTELLSRRRSLREAEHAAARDRRELGEAMDRLTNLVIEWEELR